MKNPLFFLLVLFSLKTSGQTAGQPPLFPVIDGAVMYQKVIEVPGKTKLGLMDRAYDWFNNYSGLFDNVYHKEIASHDYETGNIVFYFTLDEDIYHVDLILEMDCKDGKYRYRLFNIKHTVKGKEDAMLFAKYLVDVTAETDNGIVTGTLKGYSKGQKKATARAIEKIDFAVNYLLKSLTEAMPYVKKEADF